MTPRHPQQAPDDEAENKLLQAVHEALNEAHPATSPEDRQSPAELKQDAPLLEEINEPVALETKVEIDRTAIYLRGPTAFTA